MPMPLPGSEGISPGAVGQITRDRFRLRGRLRRHKNPDSRSISSSESVSLNRTLSGNNSNFRTLVRC